VSLSADRRLWLAGLVAAVVLLADQASKLVVERAMMVHETVDLLPFFALAYVRNTGAAFGVLAAAPPAIRLPLFLVVTIVAVAALVSLVRRTPPEERGVVVALGAVLGGALGNLVCRVRYGEVIDFLDLHWGGLHWPAFNVADSAITLGVAVILLRGLSPGATRDRR
jgi:signal peptidase II